MAAVLQMTFLNAFLQWKFSYFNLNFTLKACSQGSDSQYASIDSDEGLAPNMCQAIIWTNYGIGY